MGWTRFMIYDKKLVLIGFLFYFLKRRGVFLFYFYSK